MHCTTLARPSPSFPKTRRRSQRRSPSCARPPRPRSPHVLAPAPARHFQLPFLRGIGDPEGGGHSPGRSGVQETMDRTDRAARTVLLVLFCLFAAYQLRWSLETIKLQRHLSLYVPFLPKPFTSQVGERAW